jgi:hypothetical protein
MKALKKVKLTPLFVGIFVCFSGCATMQNTMKQITINTMVPVLDDVNDAIFRENDLDLVREGLPGNMLMVEGMARSSPDNYYILVMAARAFAGYGILLEDKDPEHASALYLKGRDYGMRALKQHSGFSYALEEGTPFHEAIKLVDDEGYIDALLWTGLCWGQQINLNLNDPMVVVSVTDVKAIMQQVMAIDDTYFYGMAHIFFGSYYATLPSIFGGGTEMSEAEFNKAFEISDGKFLLAKLYYARFYAPLVVDEKLFERELNEVLEAPSDALPEVVLLNEIAKAKARIFLKNQKQYF